MLDSVNLNTIPKFESLFDLQEAILGYYMNATGKIPSESVTSILSIKETEEVLSQPQYKLLARRTDLERNGTPDISMDIYEIDGSLLMIEYNKTNGAFMPYASLRAYHQPEVDVLTAFAHIKQARRRPKKIAENEYELGLLMPSMQGLQIKFFNLKSASIPLANYSKNIRTSYKALTHDLNTKVKGLYLFTGEPGTGKTTLLRKLAHDCDSRRFIFISADNAELLGDPTLVSTLMSHRNSVLVIEDGESSIAKRTHNKAERSKFTSNLLNITDGLMSDVLQTQVIITLNFENDSIDEAFMRPGRLNGKYEFGKLSKDDSNKWLVDNNSPNQVDKDMKLCELYALLGSVKVEEEQTV